MDPFLRYDYEWHVSTKVRFGAENRKIPISTHFRPAMSFGKRKKIVLENLLSSALSRFKKNITPLEY